MPSSWQWARAWANFFVSVEGWGIDLTMQFCKFRKFRVTYAKYFKPRRKTAAAGKQASVEMGARAHAHTHKASYTNTCEQENMQIFFFSLKAVWVNASSCSSSDVCVYVSTRWLLARREVCSKYLRAPSLLIPNGAVFEGACLLRSKHLSGKTERIFHWYSGVHISVCAERCADEHLTLMPAFLAPSVLAL